MNNTDALWRIYSPERTGIQIATTVGKLLYQVENTRDCYSTLKYFIGKVRYFPQPDIERMFSDPQELLSVILDGTGLSPVQSLLLKRDSFSHEQEVRPVYHESETSIQRGDFYSMGINPHELVDSITFDPRISEEIFENAKATFLNCFSFCGTIQKSNIYDLPKALHIKLSN